MQFKYNFEIVNKSDRVPFVDILIRNKDNNKTIGYKALLDSGAFGCVFHTSIADTINLDLSSIPKKDIFKFQGVEETKRKMTGKLCVVEIMVFQKGKNYKFDSYVIFSDEISDRGYAIVGRQGFWDRFDEISFNFKNDKFYLIKD